MIISKISYYIVKYFGYPKQGGWYVFSRGYGPDRLLTDWTGEMAETERAGLDGQGWTAVVLRIPIHPWCAKEG